MLYAILVLLLLGLTFAAIGLYLVRRDWNDPELRELSILWIYFALALIEAATFLVFIVIMAPMNTGLVRTPQAIPVRTVGTVGSVSLSPVRRTVALPVNYGSVSEAAVFGM
jgi:TRAP-type C4-dicarboxylate transport system permease small subunit